MWMTMQGAQQQRVQTLVSNLGWIQKAWVLVEEEEQQWKAGSLISKII